MSAEDWWEGALEEDTTWSLPLDDLWSGFPPPPPRPPFLGDDVEPDGLTTCALCAWSRAATPAAQDTTADLPGTLTWTVSLVVVSLLSALIGAALMVTLMHCRRSDDEEPTIMRWLRWRRRSPRGRPDLEPEPRLEDKEMVTLQGGGGGGGGRGVWGWLRGRPAAPPVPNVPATNHYTMDEAYAAVGEALYAELDRPAYQNTGYVSDAEPVSSAPSSAYYSDLSSERTYEAVGVGVGGQTGLWTPPPRLAAITETLSVPSDYV